jgi:hypothetical protein
LTAYTPVRFFTHHPYKTIAYVDIDSAVAIMAGMVLSKRQNIMHTSALGHTVEWIDGGAIAVVTGMAIVDGDAVDNWVSVITKLNQEWPKEKPYRVLFDITKAEGMSLSLNVQKRGVETFNTMPDHIRGRFATYAPNTLFGRMMRFAVRARTRSANVKGAVFFTKEDALKWLREDQPSD